MTTLTLYTRTRCHLCDEMKAVVRDVGAELSIALEEVDVDRDGALAERYGHDVPILLADGQEIARHRISAARLREWLRSRQAGHQSD